MFKRLLEPSKKRSFFLFGARGTGKTTFLHHWRKGKDVLWIDLLDPEQEDRYARHPELVSEQLSARKDPSGWVVVDEVQRVPKLLDVVHSEIEKRNTHFALTGSSARKLKHGATNLLAGRAFVHHLFPLTSTEIGADFDLQDALQYGTLPGLFALESEDEKKSYLRAYALTYLKEEVWNEHLVRGLDPFRNFLEIAAQTSGEMLNYTNIARDVGVDTKTVQSYYTILEDTLLGFVLEPYHRSIRKRQLQSPKFYFFDCGVRRALDRTLNIPVQANTYAYGREFEHFVITEMIRLSQYLQPDFRFFYLRTKDGSEVDVVIDRPGHPTALVEIKSSTQVSERHVKSLSRLAEDIPNAEAFVLSRDRIVRKIGQVELQPWKEGISKVLVLE